LSYFADVFKQFMIKICLQMSKTLLFRQWYHNFLLS